jgi:hypothetical protein
MTFLQPFILWGLPLLLIPIIIHLLNRLRHRPQPWAAMRFLRAANQTSISQAKLRQFLVLLFRVLAVIALIFFLSRPLAGGWLGWALSPAPEAIVLILDRSASMEASSGASGESRREQAIKLWTDALKTFGQSSRIVLLDSATQNAQELPNVNALAHDQFSGRTDTAADIPALLQRAYNYLSESRSGASEIWIASDLQASNWSPDDGQWERIMAQFSALKQKVRFRLLTFDEPVARNVSVSLVDAVRRQRGEAQQLNVVVDLEQTALAPEPVALRWNIGGSSSQAELGIFGHSLRWRNNFPLARASATNENGWGMIEIGVDSNPADNRLYFAYGAQTTPESLIVSSASPAATRPLQLAASDLNRPAEEWAQAVTPDNFAAAPLTNVALIVWHASTLPGAAPALLEEFVNSGGALLVFPSAGQSISLAGLSFGAITSAATNSVFAIDQWNELEGPLARTEEGYGVPLKTLEVYQRAAIAGTGGTLATFEDGAPFLIRKALGKGEIYFCATSSDPNWSSLSDGAVLVPMLQRMIATGARRVNRALMTENGDLSTRDVSNWTRVDEQSNSNPRFHAGIYNVDGRFVAVNRPAPENSLERLSADQARRLFQNVPFRLHAERGGVTDRLQGEIWRVFVTLMLLFLIAEGILILPTSGPAPARASTPTRKPAEVAA